MSQWQEITPNWSLNFSMTKTFSNISTSQTLLSEKHPGHRRVTSCCLQELCPCVWLTFSCVLPVPKIPKHEFIQELGTGTKRDKGAVSLRGWCTTSPGVLPQNSEGLWRVLLESRTHSLPTLSIPCSSKRMNLIHVLASSPSDLSQRQCGCSLRAEHSWHKELENCRDNQERKREKTLDGSGSWHTPTGNKKQRETDEESKYRLSESFLSLLKSQGLFSLCWFTELAGNESTLPRLCQWLPIHQSGLRKATVRAANTPQCLSYNSDVGRRTLLLSLWLWLQGWGLQGFWRQNQGDQRLVLLTGCSSASLSCPVTQEKAAFEDKGLRL